MEADLLIALQTKILRSFQMRYADCPKASSIAVPTDQIIAEAQCLELLVICKTAVLKQKSLYTDIA